MKISLPSDIFKVLGFLIMEDKMPSKKQEEFLEKMRRRFNINTFSDECIIQIKDEGLINELFIDNKNMTLLMYYVRNNNLEKVKFLLSESNLAKTTVVSNVNKLNALTIAVHEACKNSDYDRLIIDELLKFNPEEQVLQKSKLGILPVHFAAQAGDMALVQTLLKYNPEQQLSVKDNANQETLISFAIKSKNYLLITWLLDTYPIVLNDVLKDGFTLLHLASQNGDLALIKILLDRSDKKLMRQMPNASGKIPLIVACNHGHIEAAKELLKVNPLKQLSAIDKNGYNAFHAASLEQSEEFLTLFIQSAKPEYLNTMLHAKTKQGQTPLRMAVVLSKENPKVRSIIRLLIEAGSEITFELFEIAHRDNNLTVIEELLNHGFNLNEPDKTGKTALNDAIFLKKPTLISMLLAHGADPNITIMDVTGKKYTSLLLAIYGPDFDTIKILKQNGAKVTADIIQFVINIYGPKQNVYKKLKELLPELPEIKKSAEFIKQIEKTDSPQYHAISSENHQTNGRQLLLSQGYTKEEIESMKKTASTTPAWTLQRDKPKIEIEKPVEFLDGSLDSRHEAIFEIENSKCFCYLDAVTLQNQGFNIEDLKISRFKFGPDTIKALDKDKGVYRDTIKLSAHYPDKQYQYTHELKINDLDRIFMIQEGPLFIGIRYVPGGVHKQSQINALHESHKENRAGLEVHWPKGITPGCKMNGAISASL